MQYVFLMGGWDGVSCNNDIAVYSPDGAPSGHMAPGARRMLSPRDALAAVTVEHAPGAALEVYGDLAVQGMPLTNKRVEHQESIAYLDRPARRVVVIGQRLGIEFRFQAVIFLRDDWVYQLTAWGPADKVDEDTRAFQPFLDAFEH